MPSTMPARNLIPFFWQMLQRTLRSKLTLSVYMSPGLSSLYTSRVIQGVNMCAFGNLSPGTKALSEYSACTASPMEVSSMQM